MNKQKLKQKDVQQVPQKAYEQIIQKKLYYPKTQINRKLFEIQGLNVIEKEKYLELHFDLSKWINLFMIIKLRQHEKKSQSEDKIMNRVIFFSRPLIREFIKNFLILVKKLEEKELFVISLDIQEIWINYVINENQIQLQKIVILNEYSNDEIHFEEHRRKINNVIIIVANEFGIDDPFIQKYQSDEQLIQDIDNQLKDKQSQFYKKYYRPYNQTDLRTMMKFQQNYIKQNQSLEYIIQNNFYFELDLFEIDKNVQQKKQVQNKINELNQSIQSYIKQYDIVLNEFDTSAQFKEQIQFQLLEGIKSQKYNNYLDNFLNSEFNLEACIQKSWLQTQFEQLIIKEESLINRYCLYKIMIQLFQKKSQKQFLGLQNHIVQVRAQIKRKLNDLIVLIAQHLNLNKDLIDHLMRSQKFDYLYDAVASKLIEQYQIELTQDQQIQQSLNYLIQDIKSTLYDLLQEYIDNL